MRYTTDILINLPRDRVIELFDDQDNLGQWQPGLQSFEHIDGEPGQPGARSRLIFDQNGRRIEMIETITERNLPDVFSATYEARGVYNRAHNRFLEEGADQTRWVAENEFQFSGFMRLIGFFMRGAFPKQTREFMEHFKTFAEGA